MSHASLRFDFIADIAAHTLTVRREFAGPRQLVWDCHTRQEYLDRWYAPAPLITKTKSLRFEEGGYWHYAMVDPAGTEYWNRLDFLEIRPIDSYTGLDAFSDAEAGINPDMPRSQWKNTFTALPNGHTLVEAVGSYASAEALETVLQMGVKAGIMSVHERLDALLMTIVTP